MEGEQTTLMGGADVPAPAAPTAESQAAETTTTDAPATTDAAKPEQSDKSAGAPEQYDFKAPEGKHFDAEVLQHFSEVAKELNLTNEGAQKMLDKLAPALEAKQTAAMSEAVKQWEADTRADKEFGGEKFNENLGVANQALQQFGTPELKNLLNQSGLGNHPEVVRFFYRAGKAISQDGFVGGKPAAPEQTSIAQRMYPNMNP